MCYEKKVHGFCVYKLGQAWVDLSNYPQHKLQHAVQNDYEFMHFVNIKQGAQAQLYLACRSLVEETEFWKGRKKTITQVGVVLGGIWFEC